MDFTIVHSIRRRVHEVELNGIEPSVIKIDMATYKKLCEEVTDGTGFNFCYELKRFLGLKVEVVEEPEWLQVL